MSYCTLEDIKEAINDTDLNNLLYDAADDEAKQKEMVGRAISDADSIIDAYCSSIYKVPFETVPQLVKKISIDISIFNLYSQQAENIIESRELLYQEAMKMLKNIANNTIKLTATTNDETKSVQQTSNSIRITSNKRLFTQRSLIGF